MAGKFVEHRIGDQRVVRHIRKWLKAGVLEDGHWRQQEEGTPQGGSASPLLANLYLHYVFDLWAAQWRRRHARGDVIIVRYCDDCNSIFNHDRGYSNHTSKFFASTNSSPLNLQLSRDAVLAAGVSPDALPDDLDTFFGHAPFLTNGTAPASDYIYTRRRSVFFNFNRYAEA